ncbi:MAG TPA: ATP-dependent DNA helicase RecG [Bacilli bacterium]|nr:ATP-dependent DNA helicase RecG [Bacilli bacterium]
MSLSKSLRINEALEHIDIKNFLDVIFHFPRTYDDFSLTSEPVTLDRTRVVFFGSITSIPRIVRVNRLNIVSFTFQSQSGYTYKIVAFNRPYLINTLKYSQEVTVVGTLDKIKREINLIKIVQGPTETGKKLQSVYSLPLNLKNYEFVKLVDKAFKLNKDKIANIIPQRYLYKYKLLNRYEALFKVHFPRDYTDVNMGLRTLKYEEALIFQLKNLLIRKQNKSMIRDNKTLIDLKRANEFIIGLPYKLTSDQLEAVREIGLDMNKQELMYRLLQGDVGTGKTLVAFVSLYINYLRGEQGALMAPTDILARQHYENALQLFSGSGVRIYLLVGQIKEKDKIAIKQKLANGEIDLLIGTHALFTEDVTYPRLGFVVIDEQHRFGVNQRNLLLQKGERADLLLMSATPIPRSLALTLYGDLDLTTLKEFPFKKRDVLTKIVENDSKALFQYVDNYLASGKQVFVVAPRIEGDDERSVEGLVKAYQAKYGCLVGLVHGKIAQEEKEDVFNNFKNGTTPILVATSVIEVGVDVKNAGLMIIYSPLSFGLSALHQLRGRIGRDGSKAVCLLVSEDEEVDKLEILETTSDGFKIAEADLALRGPGEIIGVKQSGIPHFACLNLISDHKIFEIAKEDAQTILNEENEIDFKTVITRAKQQISSDEFSNV